MPVYDSDAPGCSQAQPSVAMITELTIFVYVHIKRCHDISQPSERLGQECHAIESVMRFTERKVNKYNE